MNPSSSDGAIAFPITARSIACGLGVGEAEVFRRLYQGERGLQQKGRDYGVDSWVGQVADDLPPLPAEFEEYDCRQARMVRLLWDIQLEAAVERAKVKWGEHRVALIVGTSTGGIEASERAWANYLKEGRFPSRHSFERQHALDAMIELLRRFSGVRGPGYAVSTACSSGGKVFASAARLMQSGVIDAAIVGGIDTLCKLTLRGFSSLDVLSSTPCKPFSAERSGINIGEGGALFLLEREGEGVCLLGAGESSDAYHMTAPHPDGEGAALAIRRALETAGLSPSDVSFVNVHGTGTKQNDAAEGKAIRDVFGAGMKVSATKGYTGHTLGAAGAIEAAFCLASIEQKEIPGSVGCEPRDPSIEVEISDKNEVIEGDIAISNSLAFGGSNLSLCFGRRSR